MSVMGVIHSEELPVYELPGNRLRGLATRSRGSSEVALWNHTLEPGAATARPSSVRRPLTGQTLYVRAQRLIAEASGALDETL